MKIEIGIFPKPTRGALLQAMELIKDQMHLGALSGEFDFDHGYIATGQRESDSYHVDWSATRVPSRA